MAVLLKRHMSLKDRHHPLWVIRSRARTMASYENNGRQISEESSASRSAVAQQIAFGRGGNLDSQNIINEYTFTLGEEGGKWHVDHNRREIQVPYATTRDSKPADRPNGQCWKQLFIGEVSGEDWIVLRDLIADSMALNRLVRLDGRFSLQLGGKWANKLSRKGGPASIHNSAHLVWNGELSALDIFNMKMFHGIRLGGTEEVREEEQQVFASPRNATCTPEPGLFRLCWNYLVALLNSWFSLVAHSSLFYLPGFQTTRIYRLVVDAHYSRDRVFWFLRAQRRQREGRRPISTYKITSWRNKSDPFLVGSTLITRRSLLVRAIRTDVYRRIIPDFYQLHPACLPRECVRAIEAAGHNKLMHTLNGNIERLERMERSGGQMLHVSGEVSTSSDPRLGGAMVVLSEYLYGDKPACSDVLTANSLPKEMLLQPIDLQNGVTNARRGWITRRNVYVKSYPSGSGRLPVEVTDDTAFEVITRQANLPAVNVTRAPFRSNRDVAGPNFLQNEIVSSLWTRQQDPDALRSVETLLSGSRFTGVRGNRQVLGWDAHAPARQQALHNLAVIDQQGSSYYRFFWRLWTAYLASAVADSNRGDLGPAPNGRLTRTPLDPTHLDADPTSAHAPGRVNLTALSAYQSAVPQNMGLNPEAPLQDPAAGADDNLNGLAAGTKAFLDVDGMSDEMIRWAIWALTPQRREDAFFIQCDDHNRYFQWFRWQEDLDDAVNEIFLHFGPRPAPANPEDLYLGRTPINQPNVIARSPWNQVPNRSVIASLITHMIRKHLCANDAFQALDLALNQLNMISPQNAPGHTLNAGTNMLSMFGTRSLQLPRDLTAPAYFDFMRVDMVLPIHATEVTNFLSLTPTEATWLAFSSGFRVGASINWAAYTLSMRGTEWQIANGAVGNSYQTNLVRNLTSQLYSTDVTPWQLMHRAACAHMYDSAPLISTFFAVGTKLPGPVWQPLQAPFIANPYHEMWMLKKLPRHMLLPLEGGKPTWPQDEPKPMFTGVETAMPKVRVARDLGLFTGRAWIQDGGMMANLQYYAAAQARRNVWRSDEHDSATPPIELGSWTSPFQYEWPTNPTVWEPTWMAPAGNPFGAYLLPGSVQNYSSARNRILANGIGLTEDNWDTTDAWARMTLDGEFASVAITYKPPISYKVELPPVNDFSMLLWSDEADYYAGMTLVENSASTTDLSTPSGPASGRDLSFPAHLANHNNPHIAGYYNGNMGARSQSSRRENANGANTHAANKRYTPPGRFEQRSINQYHSGETDQERQRPGIPGSGKIPAQAPEAVLTRKTDSVAVYENRNPISKQETFNRPGGPRHKNRPSINGIRVNGKFSTDEYRALRYTTGVRMSDPPNPGEFEELKDRRLDLLTRTGCKDLKDVPPQHRLYNNAKHVDKRMSVIENMIGVDEHPAPEESEISRGSEIDLGDASRNKEEDRKILIPNAADANDAAAREIQEGWAQSKSLQGPNSIPQFPRPRIEDITESESYGDTVEGPKLDIPANPRAPSVRFGKTTNIPDTGVGSSVLPDIDNNAFIDLGGGEALNLKDPKTKESLKC